MKIPPHNIAVCIPSTDYFTAAFSMQLATMAQTTHHRLAYVNTQSSYIPDNRNNAVKIVLNANAENPAPQRISHILFLDNDMVFPLDIIDQLLSWDVSIVAGTYPRRSPPHDLCYAPLKSLVGEPPPVISEGGIKLEPVAGLPTGSMLIDVNVFSQLPQPWFEQKYYFLPDVAPAHEQANAMSKYLNEFVPGEPEDHQYPLSISCDYWFSALARMHGYTLWLDHALSIQLQHIGTRALNIWDSINYKKAGRGALTIKDIEDCDGIPMGLKKPD